MTGDVDEILVPNVGAIGYMQEWASDPGTWDAWVEFPGHGAAELVCNGGSKGWAAHVAALHYERLLAESLMGRQNNLRNEADWSAYRDDTFRVTACHDWAGVMLREHYQEARREARRLMNV